MQMKSIMIHPDSSVSLADRLIPDLTDDSILIRTLGCSICGTDILKINLKLLQNPTVLGHELVGTVEKIGRNVKNFNIGDLVVSAHHIPCFECHYCQHQNFSMCEHFKKTNFVPGGFSEYVLLSQEHINHTTFKIPSHLPWQEAIFTEPLACCVRNVDRLSLLRGDTVVVIGLGSIGLMMSALLHHQDIQVIGIDLDPKRCEKSLEFGVKAAFQNIEDDRFKNQLLQMTEQRKVDGIIYTAGSANLLNHGLGLIRNGGFLNLFSHLSGEKTEIDTSQLYHREIQILSTYSASPASLKKAFEILSKDTLKLRRMLEKEYQPEEFEKALHDIQSREILKAVIKFDADESYSP